MRRLAIGVALLAAAVAAPAAVGQGDGGEARIAALFRNAGDLVVGEDVKVAGGVVGAVESIELERRRFARVEMSIDGDFAPFRRDARCEVKLASLIGENFVQCFPGSPDEPELPSREGVQIVPAKRNSAFVTPDVVFASLDMPQRERLRVILYELGVSLAGRGEDLGEVVLQALPTVRSAKDLLEELDAHRAELGRGIEDTDAILARLARRKGDIGRFIDEARAVSARTARRSGEFREAIRELPGLLRKAEPAFNDLASISRRGRPILANLRQAAPALRSGLAGLEPFAEAGRPALRRLGSAAGLGRSALRAAAPVARWLRPVARPLPETLTTATRLTEDLESKDGGRNLQRFIYYGAVFASRFDEVSHRQPAHLVLSPCMLYTRTAPIPGCNGIMGPGPLAPASRAATRKDGSPGRPGDQAGEALQQVPDAGAPARRTQLPLLEELPRRLTDPLGDLSDLLNPRPRPSPEGSSDRMPLLDFLFGN